MNDISLKVVEALKEKPVAAESPTALAVEKNEVDPLAIVDSEVGEKKEPLKVITDCEKNDRLGNCDENAKDEKLNENGSVDGGQLEGLQTKKIKEELLKDDSSDVIEDEVIKQEKCEPTEELNDSSKLVVPKLEPQTDEFVKVLREPVEVAQKNVLPVQTPQLKEPGTLKEEPRAGTPSTVVEMTVEPEVEMTEVVEVEGKSEIKGELRTKSVQSINGDITKTIEKEDKSMKRRASLDVESESPMKKLCQEVEKSFPNHNSMIGDYIQTATKNNIDEIQRHTEQLLAEIQTLRELAQKKEQEWNNILHLKKVKEEILLRLLRRKQVLSFEKGIEMNGSERTADPYDYLNQAKNLAIDKSDEISGLSLKQPPSTMNPMMAPVMPVTSHFNPMSGMPPPYDKAHMQNMPKPVYPQPLMMPGPMPGFPRDMNGQLSAGFNMPMGRQGPTKDVKSIIADYRQRNPDVTPRRGRRMKSLLNPNMMNPPRPIAPKMDGMNSLNNLNMLFNNLDMNQKAMLERLQQIQSGGLSNGLSFKDVLVQFANMQQSAGLMPPRPEPHRMDPHRPEQHRQDPHRSEPHRVESAHRVEPRRRPPHDEHTKNAERRPSPSPRLPPPPPYPEISLLPVSSSQHDTSQQNSLLHGILTKSPTRTQRHQPFNKLEWVLPTFQQATPASQSYSPTLAKLLTSPERKQSAPALPTFGQAKSCGEITITPVQPSPAPPEPAPEKPEEVVQLDDEESPPSEGSAVGSPGGRLVIDEGGGAEVPAGGGGAETEAEAPLCQGCRRRDAQFVCAGCANQWYCSRDCQVAAWDEHSDMCSG